MPVSAVGKRLPGIEILVAEILKTRTVQRVGTGFRGEVEQPAADLAVFSRKVAGLERHLFERKHRWLTGRRVGRLLGEGCVLTVDPRAECVVREPIHAGGGVVSASRKD